MIEIHIKIRSRFYSISSSLANPPLSNPYAPSTQSPVRGSFIPRKEKGILRTLPTSLLPILSQGRALRSSYKTRRKEMPSRSDRWLLVPSMNWADQESWKQAPMHRKRGASSCQLPIHWWSGLLGFGEKRERTLPRFRLEIPCELTSDYQIWKEKIHVKRTTADNFLYILKLLRNGICL